MSSPVFNIEAVLAMRRAKGGRKEYLVKWENYPDTDNTWEPAAHLSGAKGAVKKFENATDRRFEFWSDKYQTWFPSVCNDILLAHFDTYCSAPAKGSIFEFDDGEYVRTVDFSAPNPHHTAKNPKHPTFTQMNITSNRGSVRPVRLVVQ